LGVATPQREFPSLFLSLSISLSLSLFFLSLSLSLSICISVCVSFEEVYLGVWGVSDGRDGA